MHKLIQSIRTLFSLRSGMFSVGILSLFLKSVLFLLISHSLVVHTSVAIYFFYAVVWLAFCMLPLSLVGIVSIRYRSVLWFISIALISLLCIADLWYWRGFSNFLTVFLVRQVQNVENTWGAIFSMARWTDLLFISDLPLLWYLRRQHAKVPNSMAQPSRLAYSLVFVFALFSIFAANSLHLFMRGEAMLHTFWTPNETVQRLSPIGYHIWDFAEYYSEGAELQLNDADQKLIREWYMANSVLYPDNVKDSLFGVCKGQNLLVLQVESLEKFVIGQSIDDQTITPELNELSARSVCFTNIYEQINTGGSSDCDILVNASVYPLRKGSVYIRYPNHSYCSLPKLLADEGYETMAFKAEKPSYYNWGPGSTAMGFKKNYDEASYKMTEEFMSGLSDSAFLFQSIPYIASAPKPFYAYLSTISSHVPFIIPEARRALHLKGSIAGTVLEDYTQAIHYTDQQLGAFVRTLQQKGLLDNTLVVVYGDHTGVHKFCQDKLDRIQPQQSWWSDKAHKVPLLLMSKRLSPANIESIGGQVDIMPTILHVLGVAPNKYSEKIMGHSLFNSKRKCVLLANGDVVGEQSSTERNLNSEALLVADKVIRSAFWGYAK